MLCSLVVVILLAMVIGARPIRASEGEISASEAQEARAIAQRVLAELQNTRDLRPLYRAAFKDDKESQQTLVHDIASLQVSTETCQEASFEDLERFFLSIATFDYLGQLYAFSHYPAGSIDMDNIQIDQVLPPHIRGIVLENATLSQLDER
jgi:hypothetical protein